MEVRGAQNIHSLDGTKHDQTLPQAFVTAGLDMFG